MKKIVCLFSLSTLLFCLLLVVPSFTSKHTDEVDWPAPIDEYDQHLINLARHRRQVSDDEAEEIESVDPTTTTLATAASTTTTESPAPSSSTASTTEASEQPQGEGDTTATTTAAPAKSNTTKNFTIDWAEVERRWEATISEEEVGKKWHDMETGLKNGVRSLLRTIFPQIVSMSSDAKVSGNCSAGILKWIISLRHLKGWAVKSESEPKAIAIFAMRLRL